MSEPEAPRRRGRTVAELVAVMILGAVALGAMLQGRCDLMGVAMTALGWFARGVIA